MLQSGTGTTRTSEHSHIKYHVGTVTAGLAGILAGAVGITALAISDKVIRKRLIERTKTISAFLREWSSEKLHNVDRDVMDMEKSSEEMRKEAERESQKHQEVKMKN